MKEILSNDTVTVIAASRHTSSSGLITNVTCRLVANQTLSSAPTAIRSFLTCYTKCFCKITNNLAKYKQVKG